MLVKRSAKLVTKKDNKYIVDEHAIASDGKPIPDQILNQESTTEEIVWQEEVIPKEFKFDQAMSLALSGVIVGKVGDPSYIYAEESNILKIRGGVFAGSSRSYAPVMVLVDKDNIHRPGWVPTQEDMFADNWEIRIIK